MIEMLRNDVRYGVRMLAKAPAFTAVAVLTLALGIGANTAIFSIVNVLLVKPLPLPESERLVMLSARNAQNREIYFSYPAFQEARGMESFEVVSAFVPQSVNLTGRAEPTRCAIVPGNAPRAVFSRASASAAVRAPGSAASTSSRSRTRTTTSSSTSTPLRSSSR